MKQIFSFILIAGFLITSVNSISQVQSKGEGSLGVTALKPISTVFQTSTGLTLGGNTRKAPCTASACATPIPMGPLVIGAQECLSECNDDAGAVAGPDFVANNCYDFPNETVWFEVTTPGGTSTLDIEITGPDLVNPYYTIFTTADCANYTIIDCFQGSGNQAINSSSVGQNTTYLIAVSDVNGAIGDFNICVTPELDQSACNIDNTFGATSTSMGSPLAGPYLPGEIVNFCYTINTFDQQGCNWLQGITPTFGNCWDPASFDANGQPVSITTALALEGSFYNSGAWNWWPAGSVTYNNLGNPAHPDGSDVGAGWFFSQDGFIDPDNSWGDGNGMGLMGSCDGAASGLSWTVCFDLVTTLDCASAIDCNVSMETFGDGEIGNWNQAGCVSDEAAILPAGIICCFLTVDAGLSSTVCSGSNMNFNASFADEDGSTSAVWTSVPAAAVGDLSNPNILNPTYTPSGSGVVTFTLTVTDQTCTMVDDLIITTLSPDASFNYSPIFCVTGTDPSPVITGTGPGSFSSTVGLIINSSTGVIDLSASTPNTYTITHTVVSGSCTDIQTFDITINPIPTAAVSGGGVVCLGNPIPDVSIDFTGTGPWTFTYTDGSTLTTITNTSADPYIISNPPNGSYTVTAISDQNCTGTSTGSVTVTTNPTPAATISGGGTICAGQAIPDVIINLVGTSPWTVTYDIDGTSTVINPSTTPYTINGGSDGTYTITSVTDATTCPGTFTGSVDIITNPLPTATVSGGGTICAGAAIPDVSIDLTGTGPWTFTYDVSGTSTTVTNTSTDPYIISGGGNGTYTVTSITDATTCAGTSSGNAIIVTNLLPTAAISGGGTICFGSAIPNVSVDLTGTGPWTFIYTDGITPVTVTNTNTDPYTLGGLSNGTYTITSVTDATTCAGTFTGSADIITNPLPTAVVSGGGEACFGDPTPDVSIDLTGTAPWTFTYSDGLSPITITGTSTDPYILNGLAAGTYTVSAITDATTCLGTSSGNAVIVVNPLPVGPTVSNDVAYCDGVAIADMTASGTGGTITWYSDAGLTTVIGTGGSYTPTNTIGSTIYYVTETSLSNCEGPASIITITINALPVIDSEVPTDATICGVSDGTITIVASGGSGSYTYSIDGGSTFPNSTGVFAGLAVNSYQIVIDDGNCQVTGSVLTISAPSTPIAPAAGTDVIYCEGAPMIDLTAAGTGGILTWYSDAGLTSQLNTGGTLTPSAVVGNYTYYVTETVSGCQGPSAQVSVDINAVPTATVTGGGTICFGDPIPNVSIALTGSTPWSLTYSDGTASTTINPGTTPYVISGGIDGNYAVTAVSDVTGCTGTFSGSVAVFTNPELTGLVSGGGTICAGDVIPDVQIDLTGTSTWDFDYTDGSTTTAVTATATNPFIISGGIDGTYTLSSLSDASGCPAILNGSATIITNPVPVSTVSGGGTICVGDLIPDILVDLEGVGPWNFTYFDGTNPTTVTATLTDPFIISGAQDGTYTVTSLTDVNGCPAIMNGSGTILTNPIPTATISGGGVMCGGGPIPDVVIDLVGTAPWDFTYTDGVTPVTISGTSTNPYILSGLSNGTYTVTNVTDATACVGTFSGSVVISTNPSPIAAITGGGTICNGDPLPVVQINFAGTIGPWDIIYSDGTNTYNQNNVSGTFDVPYTGDGTYVIISVVDAVSLCSGSVNGSAPVTVNPQPTAIITGGGTICDGDPIPDISIDLSGTAQWNISYFDGTAITAISTNLTPYIISGGIDGTYSVTVLTDANNCLGIASGTATILTEPVPDAIVSGGGTVCAGDPAPNVLINFTPVGSGPWDVTYTDGSGPTALTISSNPYIISGGTDGTYSVTNISSDGCVGTTSGSAIILTNDLPTATISGGGTICAGEPIPDISISLTGTSPWDIVYSDGAAATTVTGTSLNPYVISGALDGTYTIVSVTDVTSCIGTFSGTAPIITNLVPAAPTAGDNATYCSGESIASLFASGSGGILTWYSDPAFIAVIGTGTALTPSNTIGTSSYYVTETSNGCQSAAAQVIITINDVPVINSEIPFDVSGCGIFDGTIDIIASGGTPPYTYSIDGGVTFVSNGGNFTGLGVNSYAIVISDINCQTNGSLLTITGPNTPLAPSAGVNATYCEGDAIDDISATAGGGGTLTWYNDAALTNLVGNNPLFTPSNTLGTTTYYVIETVASCPSPSAQVTIVINPTPTAPIATGGNTYCSGDGIANLNAPPSLGGTISWYDNAGLTNLILIGQVFTPNTAVGNYSYYVVESLNGCYGPLTQVDVIINPTPVFTVTATSPTICGGTDAEIIISGLYANTLYDVGYTLNGSGVASVGMTSNANGDIIIGGLSQGGYSSVMVALGSCFDLDATMFNLVDPPVPVFNVIAGSPITCGGIEGELLLSSLDASTVYQIDYLDDLVPVSVTLTSDASGNIIIGGLNAGSYSDIEVILNGCSTTEAGPYTLSDPNAPTFNVGNAINPTGCGFADASITVTGLDPFTNYNLTYDLNGAAVGPAAIITDASGNYVISGLQGGEYDNFEIEFNGCSTGIVGYTPLVPFFPPAPIVFTDATYCEGDVVADLNGIGVVDGEINWYGDALLTNLLQTGPYPSLFASGVSAPGGPYTYWVTETLNGCEGDPASISIVILPTPVAPGISTVGPYCEGSPVSDLLAAPQGGGTITWYSDALLTDSIGTGIAYTPASALDTVTYYITETVGNCVSSASSSIVVINPNPIAGFEPTPGSGNVPLDVYFDNTSIGGNTYAWDLGDGTTSTSFDPSVTYTTTDDYTATLIVTDVNSCLDSISAVIIVEGTSTLIIPNIFTPNGDGSNDVFNLSGTNITDIKGTIMNRWGQVVYQFNTLEAGWTGRTVAGLEAAEGTYFYLIDAVGADGETYNYQGPFQLIR